VLSVHINLKSDPLSGATPPQAQAVPIVMAGRDCILVAPRGSGKTAACIIPIHRHLSLHPGSPDASSHLDAGLKVLIIAATTARVEHIVRQFHICCTDRHTCLGVVSGRGLRLQVRPCRSQNCVCDPSAGGQCCDLLCTIATVVVTTLVPLRLTTTHHSR
jgi:superfamily II DNA/RNA helicase